MDRRFWLVPVVALVALVVTIVLYNSTQADDRTLIRRGLQQAIAAGRSGEAGGVLEKLSFGFKINRESPGSFFDVAKFVRDQRPDVEIPEFKDSDIRVDGDVASLTTSAKVKMLMMTFDLPRVDITFRREQSLAFFFIPARVWKVAEVTAPKESLPDFSGFGG
jgi:hypothetical protein